MKEKLSIFLVQCLSYGHLSNLPKNKSSIYSMKGQQLGCNVIWKFVEDFFYLLRTFVIYGFLVNQQIVIFGGDFQLAACCIDQVI